MYIPAGRKMAVKSPSIKNNPVASKYHGEAKQMGNKMNRHSGYPKMKKAKMASHY
jgi:hypothetical protein